jgi:hypothetical protein
MSIFNHRKNSGQGAMALVVNAAGLGLAARIGYRWQIL